MALTLKEIIEEADEKYPNALSVESKVRKINLREGELFRTIYRRKTATVFDVVAGQFLYPLPFSRAKIIHVIVDGLRYAYEEIDDTNASPPFLYTYENALGLFPTPEQDVKGGLFIHHWAEPKQLTSENLDVSPDFDPDFHMLHVYGLCKDMAETGPKDSNLINAFISQYEALLADFKKSLPEPELPLFRVG